MTKTTTTIMDTIATNQLTKTEYQRRIDAIRLIPTAIRAAIALGLDKDAAIHGANRAVAVITGINVLELFNGKAPKQEQDTPAVPPAPPEKYLTLGEIGAKLNTNWGGAQKRIKALGLIDARNELTEAGWAFFVESKGWSEKVVELLQAMEAV